MTASVVNNPQTRQHRAMTRLVLVLGVIWFAAVWWSAEAGLLASLWPPLIAGLVATGILIPTIAYYATPGARIWANRVGLRTITALHIWRIPAALAFFWYGVNGELPPLFWILAGIGDLIAGLWALAVTARPGSLPAAYARMHRFGFADFGVAVGTGLTFTLMLDPRMAPIAELPLAWIPLFGVGISGATHIIAFDMLRRAG